MKIIRGGMSVFHNHLAEFAGLCKASICRTFAAHLPLYICAVLFVPVTAAITIVYDAPLNMESSLFFLRIFPQFFAVGLFMAAVVQFARLVLRRSRSPLRDFGAWLHAGAVAGDRPGNMFHTVVTITPLMIAFTALKGIIPLIQPFSWDPIFERWDRVLGMGHAPWELLQPLLGHPIVTMGLNVAYNMWFIVIFGALIWQAFFAVGSLTRMQYLLAFSFSWFIAGNILASVFASVGPCYYGFLYPTDPYAPQMEYLRGVSENGSLLALQIQDRLWQSYAETMGVNIGISAMPSMHVVAAVLTALICRRSGKWLGAAMAAYAAAIIVGSVHLGWHYAVDAVAGTVLAVLFWVLAGLLVRALERLRFREPTTLIPAAVPTPARE